MEAGWKRAGSEVESRWKPGGSKLFGVEASGIAPTFGKCFGKLRAANCCFYPPEREALRAYT
eukprot:6739570-Karenia_brevis.AAC.1